jgi:hypothetical protein
VFERIFTIQIITHVVNDHSHSAATTSNAKAFIAKHRGFWVIRKLRYFTVLDETNTGQLDVAGGLKHGPYFGLHLCPTVAR